MKYKKLHNYMSFDSTKLPSTQLKAMGKSHIVLKQFFIAHPAGQGAKVQFALQK